MLQEVVNGNVTNLAVLNLSRLDRDYEDAWKLIGDTLPHYGVVFHSAQDGAGINETLNISDRNSRVSYTIAVPRLDGHAEAWYTWTHFPTEEEAEAMSYFSCYSLHD